MQQNVSAIDPMNIGDYRVKLIGGHIFKIQVLFGIFMKKFHCPTESIFGDDLACRDIQIIAG